jgi:3-phenylpropionate/trans-cinnamate dioxygenase ferredoxin component
VAEVRVCSVDDVDLGAARRFDTAGHRLCVVRLPSKSDDGPDDWYVIGDRCSHANYSLSEGDLWVDEREIECWKHGSTFSLETGEPQSLPATQPVPVYAVRVGGDDVYVDVGE